MAFTHPAALWLLALCLVPLLWSRRRSRVRQPVANLYLWREAIRRTGGLTAPRRARVTPLILTQMVCIAALALALAKPAFTAIGGRLAIVVDLSASMAARDGQGTRLAAARGRVREVLQNTPRFARVRLIAATAAPYVAGEWAATDPRLIAAIDALTPTGGTADLMSAIDLGRATDARRVVVVSDSDPPAGTDAQLTPVQIVRVGTALENVALTQLAVQRTEIGGRAGAIVAELRNYGRTARDVNVEFLVDEHPIDTVRTTLDPNRSRIVNVTTNDVGQLVTARVSGGDALAIDDVRSIATTSPVPLRVALAGPRDSFLERALAVNPTVSLSRYEPDADLNTLPGNADMLVCDRCLDPAVAQASSIVVSDGGGARARDALRIVSPTHPLVDGIEAARLTAVVSTGAVSTPLEDVVIRVGPMPAVTATDADGRRRVNIRLDLNASDFALTPVLPVLIANAVAWVRDTRGIPSEVVAGEPLAFTSSETAGAVRVVGPDGRVRDARRAGEQIVVADTDAAGVYRVQAGPLERLVAVNPDTRTESDLSNQSTAIRTEPSSSATPAAAAIAIDPWLMLLAALMLGVEWYLRKRSGRRAVIWRAATALLAVLAASGLTIPTGEAPVTTVVALDRSASIPRLSQQREFRRVDALRTTMMPADRLGLVSFGSNAAAEWRPTDRARPGSLRADIGSSGTDIAAGLRLARTMLPAHGVGRILLMSDGKDGAGHAEREALRAAAAGVQIDVAPLVATGSARPLLVTRVTAPDTAAIREPYVVSIEVSGAPGARGRIEVYRDDAIVETVDVMAAGDGTTGLSFTERQDIARPYIYRARVASEATADDDRGAGTVVTVEGQPSVLYVTTSAAALRPALSAAGFGVTVTTPAQARITRAALSTFAGVVLDSVAAEDLGSGADDALADYVENAGGGLLVLGSPRTLALSGYPTTSLNRILPIDLRPRTGQRSTAAQIVLVFDKSGSMADMVGGVSKMETARQAVTDTVRLLPPSDAIGVLAFDSQPQAVMPMSAAPDPSALQTALAAVRPGGSTAIAPAIDMALQWLRTRGASATERHIVLISDGRTSDEDAARLRELVRARGVEVSAVAIGDHANRELLEELAASTGGRAYFPASLRELPGAVAREAASSSAGGIVQEQFTPRATAHPILAGIDTTSLPLLHGYVVSAAKPSAAAVLSSHLGDPILAAWRSGLGRVAVFTGDLESPWSAGLRSWRSGGQLWTQAMRWLSRGHAEDSLRMLIRDDGTAPRLIVEAERPDGLPLRANRVEAVVRGPGGEATEVAVEPLAPGCYGATLPVAAPGTYVVSASATEDESGREHRAVRRIYWSADREIQSRGTDLALLSRIAGATGGRVLRQDQSPFEGPRRSGHADATWWLAAATLALFLLDVGDAGEVFRRGWRRRALPSAPARMSA